jgi:hypothetical protein
LVWGVGGHRSGVGFVSSRLVLKVGELGCAEQGRSSVSGSGGLVGGGGAGEVL